MGKSIKGTRTEKNLAISFAGESGDEDWLETGEVIWFP